ncbi:hypothetical protein ACQ4PT_014620 [Festuca glaucescens]
MATTVLPLILLHSLVAAASAQRQLALARPGCRDRCGNITVPYPFGIGSGCYRDDGIVGFQLECDDSGPSPPRLAILGQNYSLATLSLADGEATSYFDATRICFNELGDIVSSHSRYVALNLSSYLFSSTKNRFVALGCPNNAYFFDAAGIQVKCTSVCSGQDSGSGLPTCTGVGCCQKAIPSGISYFNPHSMNLPWVSINGDPIGTYNSLCHYMFMADTDWFTNSTQVLSDRSDDFEVPVVLDWAVRNVGNCKAARQNMTDFACRSVHSECFNVDNGSGYRCNCSMGYAGGNPYLDDGCIGISVGMILLGSMFCCLFLALQKNKLIRTKQKFFEHNGGVILQQQMRSYSSTAGAGTGGFKTFSTEELKNATNNFAADQILGRGGHSIVYKGVLTDNSVVAIKKSKMMEQAETKEFTKEMLILSQINHRNVVKLLGCCLEVEVPMLVYEYVSNGTLYQYIHGGKGLDADSGLDIRLRIAAESAEALAYMHSSASPPILHGDVKTANILLDGNLTAKVTDFGASKLAPNDEAEIATLVQGTCGYLDPEYLMTCRLTDKSDVYSFGVVLLELLTRKKVLSFDGPEENRSLVSRFVLAVKAGQHDELMDSEVRREMGPEALEEVTYLLMRCVSMKGEERPGMKEVAERLEALRRYQQHPWGQAGGGDPEEEDADHSLLGNKQNRNGNYNFRSHDVLNLEEGSTQNFSL